MRFRARFLALLLLSATASWPAAAAPAPASRGTEGYLYGRVTTDDDGVYEGRLRWDDEESSWGDLFNSAKRDNPWLADAPASARQRKKHTIEIFGFELGSIGSDYDDTRQFIMRFGDLAKLEPGRGDRVRVTLKDGYVYDAEGGSNDVGAKIDVWDARRGAVKVHWQHIRAIDFLPTPANLAGVPKRLYGKVATRDGDFTGVIQWDQDECLGDDKLDGETEEDKDVALPMGGLRAIERRSSRSSTVTLADGRTMVLSGTNDVNDENRGIYVDDLRYGRVLVPWDEFERVDFSDGGSGPSYDSYAKGERLAGTVTTRDGRKLTGILVYDLDESETTELLNGKRHDLEYNIPFSLVASVAPRRESARVTLVSGEELVLEGVTDVSADNAGMLIFVPGRAKPDYVAWEDVERVDFAARSKR
jgi:hypothetical protein